MGADRDLISLFEHDLFENPIAAFWDHSIAVHLLHLLNGGCLRIWRRAPDPGARFRHACRSPSAATFEICLQHRSEPPRMKFPISLTINGVRRDIDLDDPRVTLLDLLRERLHLTGTK